ncbi:MAG: adenylyltransferase/cytidyltransferase family protein [bacterium]|nr:adenylyltransferase/cytidyltransferase family protein [bacterium]
MKAESATVFRSMTALKTWVNKTRAKKVVLTNGCFDPLHVGHVRYLRGAKEHGDYLVVAVNDDKSTRALKGPNRPVSKAGARARVIAGLKMVDAVLVFGAPNVSGVLNRLRPAFHAKGTDYTRETVPELETSRALGIETIIVGDPKDHGSTEIVERLSTSNRKGKESR